MNGPSHELMPMSVGDIFDGAFRLYRAHFLVFLTIALAVYIPLSLIVAALSAWAAPGVPEPGQEMAFSAADLGVVLAGSLGIVALFMVVYPLVYGAMVHNISAGYLGEPIGAAASYRRALPRLPRLIVANFLAGMVIGVGFLLLIVPGVIFSVWLMLLTAAIMLEGRGIFGSMNRSYELIRGNFFKGLTVLVVVVLIGVVYGLTVGAVMAMVPWPSVFMESFVLQVVDAIVLPIQTAPVILLYYDLRIRKEGFDLERLAEEMGQPPRTPLAPEAS